MNKAITIHLTLHTPDAGNYVIRLHGNAIIKHENGVISVCNGNYKLTQATKKALIECLGGEFNGSTYFINGIALTLTSEWQVITEGWEGVLS